LTEGLIEYGLVTSLGGTRADARRLVDAGLWIDDVEAGGYRFHQWEQANPTRQDVVDSRAAAAERKRRSRQRVTGGVTEDVTGGVTRPSQSPRTRRPDPTRPLSTSGGDQSSSSHLAERDAKSDETSTTDDIDSGGLRAGWRLFAVDADVPAGVDPVAEWDRFLERNGDGADLRDPAAAFRGWLKSAKPKPVARATPSPGRPECPLHPGNPTGSVTCPECAAINVPAPDLRQRRDLGA
jgi:hypothetical protein